LANDAKAEKDKLAGEKEELESQLETIRIEKEMVYNESFFPDVIHES